VTRGRREERRGIDHVVRRVTFHFDPSCPWTWLTSRWLRQVAAKEGFEIELAPFSLAHLEQDEAGTWSVDKRDKRESAQSVLRVVQHLLEAGDRATAERVYETWGDRAHQQRRRRDPALVAEVVRAARLDEAAAAAAGDTALDATIAERTDAALAAVGEGVGSPILEWDGADGPVWVFGPIIDELPPDGEAVELWQGVQALAAQTRFKELKRGRTGPPSMPPI